MLIQFKIKNFKSFRDETILDMSAADITEFNQHVIEFGTEKILPVTAIFGANASGKSNVIQAFQFMRRYVLNSSRYIEDASSQTPTDTIKPPFFALDENSKKAGSTFETYFTMAKKSRGIIYDYGFVVGKNGVEEEWLKKKSKTSRDDYQFVFYRNDKELDLSGINQKFKENIKVSLSKNVLVLSLGAVLHIPELLQVRNWFAAADILDFGIPRLNYYYSKHMPYGFREDKAVQQKVADFLAMFDDSIKGFRVTPIENEEHAVQIETIHRTVDGKNMVYLPFSQESAGTLKMFALYPFLAAAMNTGGVLFIDELDSRLHPLLVRAILLMFTDQGRNSNHAQLIFTTHDAWQLNRNNLRRDEIWFTEKTDEGISSLYSLADFVDENGDKIRKDENYEKNYLLGKYGAVPELSTYEGFMEKNHEK